MRRLLFFLFTLFVGSNMFGQYKKLIYLEGETDKLLDLNGKLVCDVPIKFGLNRGNYSFQRNIYLDENKSQYDFYGFPIILKSRFNNFIGELNENCQVNTINTSYSSVSRIKEGFYLTVKDGSYKSKEKIFAFLDSAGNPAFEHLNGFSKAFWFSEGLASVWIDSIGWVFLDSKGNLSDIIDDSLKRSEIVTPFKNGFAMVIKKISDEKGNDSFLPFLIDKKGKVVLNISEKVNRRIIRNFSNFNGEIFWIRTEMSQNNKNAQNSIVILNTSGEIVKEIQGKVKCFIEGDGFIVLHIYKENNSMPEIEIFNKAGMKLSLPEETEYVEYLDANKFKLTVEPKNKGRKFYLFDAVKNEIVFHHPKAEILGLVENRLILEGVNKDIRVINYEDNKLLYQSYPNEIEIYDLDEYMGTMEDIIKFHCSEDRWVERITEMSNLKFLTLNKLKIKELPDISKLVNLTKLKLEDCSKINILDMSAKNLTHLSLKSCVSISNVFEFVMNQSQLEVLHIINMDLLPNEKLSILEKIPHAIIDGNSKSNNSIFMNYSDF